MRGRKEVLVILQRRGKAIFEFLRQFSRAKASRQLDPHDEFSGSTSLILPPVYSFVYEFSPKQPFSYLREAKTLRTGGIRGTCTLDTAKMLSAGNRSTCTTDFQSVAPIDRIVRRASSPSYKLTIQLPLDEKPSNPSDAASSQCTVTTFANHSTENKTKQFWCEA